MLEEHDPNVVRRNYADDDMKARLLHQVGDYAGAFSVIVKMRQEHGRLSPWAKQMYSADVFDDSKTVRDDRPDYEPIKTNIRG